MPKCYNGVSPKRAKDSSDAPNCLSVQMNECEWQSEDVLGDLRMDGDAVTSVKLSVSFTDKT